MGVEPKVTVVKLERIGGGCGKESCFGFLQLSFETVAVLLSIRGR